jgi:phenylacetate-CoA oxygenase PaaI subunit
MAAATREALRNALLAVTDTKLFLGYHYGEWTFGPPSLEAAIACCSMSQDEFGHSRLLNGILSQHFGDDPEGLLNERSPQQFAHAAFLDERLSSWADVIAANLVLDIGVTLYLAAFRGSNFEPLRVILDKLLEEEKYHLRHAEGWLRTISRKDDGTRDRLAGSIDRALASWIEWLGPDTSPEDRELVDAGIKRRTNAEIFEQYIDWLLPLVQNAGLSLSERAVWTQKREQTPWDDWQPVNRRRSASTPDETILQQLRGSKNEVFKLVK